VNANGSLRRMDYRDVVLNLFLGNELEGGVTNVYLRVLGDDVRYIPLFGPRSTAIVEGAEDRFTAHGEWSGLRFAASLVLARSAPAWFWHVVLEHQSSGELTVDLIYAQDLALAPYGSIRLNEYYVSQYLDYTPLAHGEHGTMLGVRQNLAMGGRNPWALIGALGRGVSFATDALQLYGLEGRARGTTEALARRALPGKRLQHEHSMAVLQHAPVKIAAGTSAHAGFFGWLEEHHASPTSAADVAFCAKALSLPEASLHATPKSIDCSRHRGATLSGAPTDHRTRSSPARTATSCCARKRPPSCARTGTSCVPAVASFPTRPR
jgi:cellobiose phosphorylase